MWEVRRTEFVLLLLQIKEARCWIKCFWKCIDEQAIRFLHPDLPRIHTTNPCGTRCCEQLSTLTMSKPAGCSFTALVRHPFAAYALNLVWDQHVSSECRGWWCLTQGTMMWSQCSGKTEQQIQWRRSRSFVSEGRNGMRRFLEKIFHTHHIKKVQRTFMCPLAFLTARRSFLVWPDWAIASLQNWTGESGGCNGQSCEKNAKDMHDWRLVDVAILCPDGVSWVGVLKCLGSKWENRWTFCKILGLYICLYVNIDNRSDLIRTRPFSAVCPFGATLRGMRRLPRSLTPCWV